MLGDVNQRAKPARRGFRITVTLTVALALCLAGLAVWQFWWVGRQATGAAGQAGQEFLNACPGWCPVGQLPGDDLSVMGPMPVPDDAVPPDGVTIALLTLPGSTTTWPIRVGTDDTSLDAGVGWYAQTSGPGQIGNMAVVGRRLPSGGAFDNILALNVGDQVSIDTCAMHFVYTIRVAPRDLTVQASDTWVLDAVPGQPNVMPTAAWLTLIANQDVLPSDDRAVGFAELTSAELR